MKYLALQEEEISRFKYHPADTEEKKLAHEQARAMVLECAEELMMFIPESHEREKVLDKLDEVLMWANAGVARHYTNG